MDGGADDLVGSAVHFHIIASFSGVLCKPIEMGIMMPTVHVCKSGGVAKIQLDDGAGEPMVLWHEGLKQPEKVRAFLLVVRNREKLLTEWRKIHGGP